MVEVAERLIEFGAWRTLQNARGERPTDIAKRQGHRHLTVLLSPEYKHDVPLGALLRIQSHFHAVIHERLDRYVSNHSLRLPELEVLLELERPRMWLSVPGMYGGFRYWLDNAGVDVKLVSESWCRIGGGSGQRHEITSAGYQLVDEEFM